MRADAIRALETQQQVGKESAMGSWDGVKEHIIREVAMTQEQLHTRLCNRVTQRLLGLD